MINQFWTSNILFLGLSDDQLKLVEPHISEMKYAPQEVIMAEGDSGSFLFLIDEGTVTVNKDELVLTTRVAGDLVGLMSLIDLGPRSATVVAGPKGAKGFVMSKEGLEGIMDSEKDSIVSTMLLNYIKYQQNAIRNTNSLSLHEARSRQEQEKKREKSAKFLVQMVMGFAAVAAMIGLLTQFFSIQGNPYLKFAPLILFWAWSYFYMTQSNISQDDFGLDSAKLKVAFLPVVKATFVFVILIFLLKLISIKLFPEQFGVQLIDLDRLRSMSQSTIIWLVLFLSVQAYIEELLARGCIQNGLHRFLIGQKSKWTGIFAASLIFSLTYLFFDVRLAIFSFISGLFLGYLFYKWRSTIANSIAHIMLAAVAILLFHIVL